MLIMKCTQAKNNTYEKSNNKCQSDNRMFENLRTQECLCFQMQKHGISITNELN